jgi:hypothetical protein
MFYKKIRHGWRERNIRQVVNIRLRRALDLLECTLFGRLRKTVHGLENYGSLLKSLGRELAHIKTRLEPANLFQLAVGKGPG